MKRIAIYGGAFDPPGLHHRWIAQAVSRVVDTVHVVPSGVRTDKTALTEPRLRLRMCHQTFFDLPNVRIDEQFLHRYVPSIQMLAEFGSTEQFELVVGSDLIIGGATCSSEIQSKWFRGMELWSAGRFIVIPRRGYSLRRGDLPPKAMIVVCETSGSSTEIRKRVRLGENVRDVVMPDVAVMIQQYNLYRGER